MGGGLKNSHCTDTATAARVIIRRALDEELARSASTSPHKVLDAWLPQLFIDVPVQE